MVRMPLGSSSRAALIAAWTSRAAVLMSLSRSNWIMIRVLPWLLRLFIWLTPAIEPSERSNGVATVEAMICGLAPGRLACTVMVGKSICGSGATGSRPKLTPPSSMIARLSSKVATGRRIKGAERFTVLLPLGEGGAQRRMRVATVPRLKFGQSSYPHPQPLSRMRERGGKAKHQSYHHPRCTSPADAARQAIEVQVDHRCGE